jgi:hypothetical protein
MVALAVSPDGTSIYVATGAGILVFDRDPLTGGLQQKAKRWVHRRGERSEHLRERVPPGRGQRCCGEP